MSVYRPRFIQCLAAPDVQDVIQRRGRFANAHDDDVVRLPDGTVSFVDDFSTPGLPRAYYYSGLIVEASRSDRYDDPMEAFSDLTPHCVYASFEIRVSSPFIQRRLPGIDKRWKCVIVRVEYGTLRPFARICFSSFRSHATYFNWHETDIVKSLYDEYTRMMRTYSSVLYAVPTESRYDAYRFNPGTMILRIDPDTARVITVDERRVLPEKHSYYIYEYICETSQRWSVVEAILLRKKSKILGLSDVDRCFSMQMSRQLDLCGSGNTASFFHFQQDWFADTEWRTARPHALILDVCLALASLWLPPYVLLEIIDWLPPSIVYHDARWKIRLIQGVRDSVLRLRVNEPIARRTRAKTQFK